MPGSSAPQPAFEKPSSPEAAAESGYSHLPITKAPSWHGIIAWDALFNGMATGLFLVAAVSELAAPTTFTPVARMAYPIALVILLVDLSLLVIDLGDPLRFHHMLRIFKPRSPMSFGTWCLTIFSLPLTVAALLSVLAELGLPFERTRILAVIVGLLPAFGSAAYKGVLLSTNAQPGWRDARWMGGYLTNSAILMGCAELLVVATVMRQAQAIAILRIAFMVLLVLNLIPLARLFLNLREAHARLYRREQQWRMGALIVASGLVIPLGLMLLSGGLVLTLSAAVVLLFESWLVRFVYVKIPHTPPREVHTSS